jgi:predicted nucleotidyltransferase
MKTTTDFQRLLKLLLEAKVDFVLIGGLAAIAHGSAYNTFDLDICYDRKKDNVIRLCQMLNHLHARLREIPEDLLIKIDMETILIGLNFTLETDAGDLDLLGEVQPLGMYDAVRHHSQPVEVFGQTIQVLTLDALIRAKRAAGRTKDLLILPELEALREIQSGLPRSPEPPETPSP